MKDKINIIRRNPVPETNPETTQPSRESVPTNIDILRELGQRIEEIVNHRQYREQSEIQAARARNAQVDIRLWGEPQPNLPGNLGGDSLLEIQTRRDLEYRRQQGELERSIGERILPSISRLEDVNPYPNMDRTVFGYTPFSVPRYIEIDTTLSIDNNDTMQAPAEDEVQGHTHNTDPRFDVGSIPQNFTSRTSIDDMLEEGLPAGRLTTIMGRSRQSGRSLFSAMSTLRRIATEAAREDTEREERFELMRSNEEAYNNSEEYRLEDDEHDLNPSLFTDPDSNGRVYHRDAMDRIIEYSRSDSIISRQFDEVLAAVENRATSSAGIRIDSLTALNEEEGNNIELEVRRERFNARAEPINTETQTLTIQQIREAVGHIQNSPRPEYTIPIHPNNVSRVDSYINDHETRRVLGQAIHDSVASELVNMETNEISAEEILERLNRTFNGTIPGDRSVNELRDELQSEIDRLRIEEDIMGPIRAEITEDINEDEDFEEVSSNSKVEPIEDNNRKQDPSVRIVRRRPKEETRSAQMPEVSDTYTALLRLTKLHDNRVVKLKEQGISVSRLNANEFIAYISGEKLADYATKEKIDPIKDCPYCGNKRSNVNYLQVEIVANNFVYHPGIREIYYNLSTTVKCMICNARGPSVQRSERYSFKTHQWPDKLQKIEHIICRNYIKTKNQAILLWNRRQ